MLTNNNLFCKNFGLNKMIKRPFSSNAHLDYYNVLGVDKNTDQADIKKKYYELVKKFHPDIDKKHEAKFTQIVEAYNTLSDVNKRNEYDNMSSKFGFMGNTNRQYGGNANQNSYNTNQSGFYDHKDYSFYSKGPRKAKTGRQTIQFQDQFGRWHTVEVDTDNRSSGVHNESGRNDFSKDSENSRKQYENMFHDWKDVSSQYHREQKSRQVYDQVFDQWKDAHQKQHP